MRRSLGDKRRKIGDGTDGDPDQIADIVREYGQLKSTGRNKIFDNEDFGYTRVAVERPLRLRYQMDAERKARFLDACPELLDDVQDIDQQLGRKPLPDWNEVWKRIADVLDERGSKWKAGEQKLFRSVFTEKDPEAKPVLAFGVPPSGGSGKPGGKGPAKAGTPNHEADPDLRDFENVPLKEDIDKYFEREVLPHVADAWMDRSKDKVGYEINFNRHFYRYTPPRPLEKIDAELKKAEDEILQLLNEVTT